MPKRVGFKSDRRVCMCVYLFGFGSLKHVHLLLIVNSLALVAHMAQVTLHVAICARASHRLQTDSVVHGEQK